jgi:hypothetical protein
MCAQFDLELMYKKPNNFFYKKNIIFMNFGVKMFTA